jgi:hypothetical protein
MAAPVVLYSEETGLGLGDPDLALEGTGRSVPRGIEAQFEYNGLILNDRTVIDKYRIMQIDGLDDADVRDSRDENPGQHGETPNFALYGGRTIAITGRIEAYSLAKLRDMQQALRTAFQDISEEKKLNFLTGSTSTDHYISCKKFSKNQWGEEQKDKHVFFRDFVITLRASDPRFYSRSQITSSVFPNILFNGGFELATASGWVGQGTGWSASAASGASGISTEWSSEGEYSYLINVRKDNSATQRSFALIPTVNLFADATENTDYQFMADLNVIDNPGTGIRIFIGFYDSGFSPLSTVLSNYYTDLGTETLTVTGTSPASTAKASIGLLFDSTVALDQAWFYIDNLWFSQVSDTAERGRLLISNTGNFETNPVFTVYGEIEAPEIVNETTEETLTLKSDTIIADGDYYQIDVARRTIIDSMGNNKFSSLDPSSDWMTIAPGDNYIRLQSTTLSLSAESLFRIESRSAWL